VRDFPKPVARLDLEFVRRSQNLRGLNRATKGRRVNGDNLFITQPLSQPACLLAAFIGKRHICCAGKSIFCA